MIPSHNPSKPVVKMIFSPEASADALLARKSVWSCNAPVSVMAVGLLVLSIFWLTQHNFFGAAFAFVWAAMCGLILFYSIPGSIAAKRHEKHTELYTQVVDFMVKTAKVGGVDTKQVDKLLEGQNVSIKNFTFIAIKEHGLAGIAVSESPDQGGTLTAEQEYARVRKQFPEAVIIT